MKMAALQPEEIIVNPKESEEMEEKDDLSKHGSSRGPDSPDGVDGLSPMDSDELDQPDDDSDESDESGSESEEEEEKEEEAMPDGDSNADLHALLQFSKSRLEKKPQPPPPVAEPAQADEEEEEEDDDDDDDDGEEDDGEDALNDSDNSEEVADAGEVAEGGIKSNSQSVVEESPAINTAHSEEKKTDADTMPPQASPEPVKDQAYYIELAMKNAKGMIDAKEAEARAKKAKEEEEEEEDYLLKLAEQKTREAELMAKQDGDPTYLLRLAEQKTKEAEAKAREDEEATGPVLKPNMPRRSMRGENAELWALLNYSKKRLETGSTPQVKRRTSVKAGGSVKGEGDNMSVSSKLSKSSRRSLSSKNSVTKAAPVSVVGGPEDLVSPSGSYDAVMDANGEKADKIDAPMPDVTDNGDDSVDGSVSLESETKNSNNDNESDNSGDDDSDDEESSEEEEDEEEDELPDFLKDAAEEDPEEAKAMYEAAKFKAASILSVSEEKLTDVQMLQAIAIAEEAARKGDDKFSTKRSLFKLNKAKIEDLKSFLKLSMGTPRSSQGESASKREEVGWGFGRGRFLKKIGSVCQDFKEKCNEIDSKMEQERAGKPTNKELFQAGMLDLKAQIEEYEKIVTATAKKGKKPDTAKKGKKPDTAKREASDRSRAKPAANGWLGNSGGEA
eukprot:CAMPEP_0172573148 /NCGR_PEP_ID=MMETSP1067-20121228/136041_1 /TAXON_ID=265564 ORGANISM="Thalassiosira punctigera, Strain Tpunct2005C2" /NCGR_SAMPLE_ID=MMETSP1067 /ASSEMBLY_ACC=CAM_ASM_000444 /LENGTH=672 /DNA_ID=CAMNT_0013365745 /DNA_START=158 /DNA_END=2176 /DNA_ORIENTATION=-